ncbi:MAG: hypothetical protein Q9217_004188 [Psora testacea]
MPSRSNPNTPKSLKPRTSHIAKIIRQRKQRTTKDIPRTSQAIRKAAPLSRKKARKMDRKLGYARKRALEEALRAGEVDMRDLVEDGKAGKKRGEGDVVEMNVDPTTTNATLNIAGRFSQTIYDMPVTIKLAMTLQNVFTSSNDRPLALIQVHRRRRFVHVVTVIICPASNLRTRV